MKRAFRLVPSAGATVLCVAATVSAADPVPSVLRLEDAERIAQSASTLGRPVTCADLRCSGANCRGAVRLPSASDGVRHRRAGSRQRHARPTTTGPPSVGTPTGQPRTFEIYSVGVTATQLIWDFGQTIDRTTRGDRVSRRAAVERAHHRVSGRAPGASGILSGVCAEGARRASARRRCRIRSVISSRFRASSSRAIRPEIDLAQARNDLANARGQLIKARAGYATARAQLNQAMGVLGPTNYDVAEDALDGGARRGRVPRMRSCTRRSRRDRSSPHSNGSAGPQELTLSSIRGGLLPVARRVRRRVGGGDVSRRARAQLERRA